MNTTPTDRRPWLMAVAAVVVIAVVLVVFRNDDPDSSAANAQTSAVASTTVVPLTTASTTDSSTVTPSTSTSSTDVGLLSDAEVAAAMLISAADYAPGWVWARGPRPPFDKELASSIPACAAFLSSVFEAENSATVSNGTFHHEEPTLATMGQNVLVFTDEDAARAFFTAVTSGDFPACGLAYTAAGGSVVDGCAFYANVAGEGAKCGASSFSAIGDEIAGSAYAGTWVHPITGDVRGPEEYFGAIMRVGRSVTFMGALHMGDVGDTNVEVVTQAQFESALRTVAATAAAALARGSQV